MKRRFVDSIEVVQKQKSLFTLCARAFLLFISLGYRFLIFSHRMLWKIRTPYTSKLFTISIGNISVGGTGKTPFTLYLAQQLCVKEKVGIVLRGYKGTYKEKVRHVLPTDDASCVGDEALLMKQHASFSEVFVARKRKYGAEAAEKARCTVLLLDDALQHHAITRDINVVVINGFNPFGYFHCMPRGYLREPIQALSRADYIVLNNSHAVALCNFEKTLRRYTQAPLITADPKIKSIKHSDGSIMYIVPQTKVALFSAIGTPQSFTDLIQSSGYKIVSHLVLPDHEEASEEELQKFWQKAQNDGAEYLLTTEKDAVKFKGKEKTSFCIVHIELEVHGAEDLIKKIGTRKV